MALLTPTLSVVILCVLFLFFVALPRRKRASMLPPGPPRTPILGNMRQMPTAEAPLVFHKWAETYGDVMYLEVPGQSMIILDSLRAAEDLLDHRSLIYSDRPRFPLLEIFGWKAALTMLPYGKKFAKHRQMHQAYLNRHKCADYLSLQIQEAQTLANNLLSSKPSGYESCLSRFSTGIIARIVAGHTIRSNEDAYLSLSSSVSQAVLSAGVPGTTAIDFFPILQHFPRWFPGTHYMSVAEKWRPVVRESYDYPVQSVKRERVGVDLRACMYHASTYDSQESGQAKPSFILTQLQKMESWDSVMKEDEDDLKGAATSSSLSIFVLAMVLHPNVQVKAQEELDRVIGKGRLPEFGDREKLPYVECVFQEIFRWVPGVPLGIPHRCMKDNIYRGMLIPAGSIVFPNIKGMSLDANIYSNPTTFCPERYLPKPAGFAEPHFPAKFGFGRRICTGQYLGDNSVWIAIATILASCTITNALNEQGNKIVPEGTINDTFQAIHTRMSALSNHAPLRPNS
ncbi:Cytochrome P450 [Mycena venus]|uniref:Cytochrome P450 n=1 Tax=Mycena venus TaxID=2733690 RepID=A0A8H7CN88_9AGAR|nr:Cytochrome P450 [Mycena venus]